MSDRDEDGGDPFQAPCEGLPRLLAGIPEQGAMTLEQHLSIHGPAPRLRTPAHRQALIARVERAGLLGRGGGAFPLAVKLRAVASGARWRKLVVVNGAEGEPASMKDRTLMRSLPHLVLDGAELAAAATGAGELVLAVCRSERASARSLALALEERRALGATPPARIASVPDHYLAGQESALVSYLNGGQALPSFTPPLPFEAGVARRPTLVSNVETLAHLALIARHGSRWFRQLGTASQPGSALLTLLGAVERAGVYEIEYGASLSSLIEAAGGATAHVRAALIGGYAGSWIDGGLLGAVALSDEHLAAHDAALRAGVVALLDDRACPVAETARVASWLARQSSGQCGPCVNGLDTLSAVIGEIGQTRARAHAERDVSRLASLVAGRGACAHPDGAVAFILSAVRTFAPEFAEHARHGPCEACARPAQLPLPHASRRAGAARTPVLQP